MLARPGVVRRRPGLLGTMARTAVVAGTASATVGAVRGWQGRRQQQTLQQQAAQQAVAAQQQELDQREQPDQRDLRADQPPAGGAGPGDLAARLQQLADLNSSGALSDAEFAAAKAKLLGT